MKPRLFIITAILLALTVTAQAGKGANQLQEVRSFQGRITQWTYNDDFIYNGFYFQSGEVTYRVKLPRYMVASVRELGDHITVNGVAKQGKREQEIKVVSILAGNKTVYDIKPASYAENQVEKFVAEQGKVVETIKNSKNEIKGLVLDNKVMLRVSSNVARQLPQLSQPGTTIEYTGSEKVIREGEVTHNGYRIVRGQTLTVNGTQYLIR